MISPSYTPLPPLSMPQSAVFRWLLTVFLHQLPIKHIVFKGCLFWDTVVTGGDIAAAPAHDGHNSLQIPLEAVYYIETERQVSLTTGARGAIAGRAPVFLGDYRL